MINNTIKKLYAGYLSQSYSAIIGIIFTPVLISFLGFESYGLVSIYALLNAWFAMADLGLGGTITKYVASQRGQREFDRNSLVFLKIVRIYFVCVSLLILINYKTFNLFFDVEQLFIDDDFNYQIVLALLTICISLRFYCAYMKAIILGHEEAIYISNLAAFMNTLRFVFIIPVLLYRADLLTFFIWQTITCVTEWFLLRAKLPVEFRRLKLKVIKSDFKANMSNFKFTAALTISSCIWVVMSSVDRFVLAQFLDFEAFGKYSAILVLAMGLIMLNQPVLNVLVPRLTFLRGSNADVEYSVVIMQVTRVLFVSVIPLGITISFNPASTILAWSGDSILADYGQVLLRNFMLGNIFVVLCTVAFSIQVSFGNIRMHILTNLILLFIYVPLLFLFAHNQYITGVSLAWLWCNFIAFCVLSTHCFRFFSIRCELEWWRLVFKNALLFIGLFVLFSISDEACINRLCAFKNLIICYLTITILAVGINFPSCFARYLRSNL